MPFGKSFNVVLESASESENDAFLLLDSSADGVDVEDRVIAVDASQSETKPTGLTENHNGDSDYDKTKVIANNNNIILNIYPDASCCGRIQNGQEPMSGSFFLFL